MLYGDSDEQELARAIQVASERDPHMQELKSCIRSAFKPSGSVGGVAMLSAAKRGTFDWHISKGPLIPRAQQTSKTCSLFGVKDPATGVLVLTAVGRHGRGSRFYKLDHWRDQRVSVSTFQL